MPRNDAPLIADGNGHKNGPESNRSESDGRAPSSRRSNPVKTKVAGEASRWTFFSNHAHVLICLYENSDMVLRELAILVGITERSVQSIIQDLERAGFIERERVGRRNRYHVIRNKNLRHPIEEHCTIDMLVDVILENRPQD